MGLSPVAASEHIVDKYKRYLSTIFEISDENYKRQFDNELLSQERFAVGPYLDVTNSFEKGKSILDLIDEGILPKSFKRINMPLSRPLYKHQEVSTRKVLQDNNIVVSTGTGSGKTESFLMPILSHIIKEHEDGELTPGVRALIIYPMNALANDQMERMREILKDFPEITYGSYTGQTQQDYKRALVDYKALNNGETPKENELISREQMKKTPPHILITNYAMLEYLMVRPDDSVFFDQKVSDKWKFIVLDEAHVYNGSTGIEVSMLLRRLKATLSNDKINYILTSATLGDKDENKQVAKFAESLCDSNFYENDIIRAYRIDYVVDKFDYKLDQSFYNIVAESLKDAESEEKIINKITAYLNINKSSNKLEEFLYDVVIKDETFWMIKNALEQPRTVVWLANQMKWAQDDIVNFVEVASKCEKNGDKLFDSRYHMFIRATEGVFITLPPSGKLFLDRKNDHYEPNGDKFKVFEIATCVSCHAIYLLGKIENNCLSQYSNNIEASEKEVFLLSDTISDTDEDHLLTDEEIEANEYEICARCGYLHKANQINDKGCEHGNKYYVKVIRVSVKSATGKLTKCLSCESTNNFGVLRKFFSGQEAVTSVLGTALFEEIPSYSIVKTTVEDEVDDTGFGTSESFVNEEKKEEAKQFIAFSDSRQAAAYFSSYFDQTYRGILYKRLIIEALNNIKNRNREVSVVGFVDYITRQFEKYNIVKNDEAEKEAWKAILHELVDNASRTSLYGQGLIDVSLMKDGMSANTQLNLSSEEVGTLCNVLVMGMLSDAAIYYDVANMTDSDKEFYTNNGVEYSYNYSDSDKRSQKRSFIPSKANMTNKRVEYLQKILKLKGFEKGLEEAIKLLGGIWKNILIKQQYLISVNGAYKVNSDKIVVSNSKEWYICPKCKKITVHNIGNVCPTYKCDGVLQSLNVDEYFINNHYHNMYQNLDIRKMRIKEHTAQLNKETAYGYQKKFKNKEIDILSCSTTFEMGVDVGSLETVFMRNMPPSPANYAQRAGRAGRSRDSVAYALTFCNKSNHDFTFFKTPERMIRGKINPPKFNGGNSKIAIRHLYASALSFFWKKNPEYFKKIVDMVGDDDADNGISAFAGYLSSKPIELTSFAKKFLPNALVEEFEIDRYGWIEGILNDDSDNPGILSKAIAEYNYEVNVLKTALVDEIKEASDKSSNKGYRIPIIRERIKTYQNESILTFLSRKNVMPKYGFPVDTVEMNILDKTGKMKLGLQLQRDLEVAISEYAPDSQIVANNNLITSRYIRKVPNMSWKIYDYIKCDKCNTLNLHPHLTMNDDKFKTCKQCGEELSISKKETFLIPSFGFEAGYEGKDKITKPKLVKPEKTYRGEISYVGNSEFEFIKHEVGVGCVEVSNSKMDEMAVLNKSNFFVCESCGYTELADVPGKRFIRKSHNKSSGYHCQNDGQNILKKFALGYRFATDVVQIKFLYPQITDIDEANSILYGLLSGMCVGLNIERTDISGCLQYFYNKETKIGNYALMLFDKTPGGAGHVSRLNEAGVLEAVLKETLNLVSHCTCGGELGDSSCYACLRNYYNQQQHDNLKRMYVIKFLGEMFNGKEGSYVPVDNNEKKESRVKNFVIEVEKNSGVSLTYMSPEDIWSSLKDESFENVNEQFIGELIFLMAQKGCNIPDKGDVCIVVDNTKMMCDYVWSKRKVMLFTEYNYDAYKIAKESQEWMCFYLDNKMNQNEFLSAIKGE